MLMTFGFAPPNKGIRHMIEAMRRSSRRTRTRSTRLSARPSQPRPQGRRVASGNAEDLARELGVKEHVRFIDSFVEQEELLDHASGERHLCPRPTSTDQITSER